MARAACENAVREEKLLKGTPSGGVAESPVEVIGNEKTGGWQATVDTSPRASAKLGRSISTYATTTAAIYTNARL